MRIAPLRFVSAAEMQQILEPFAPPAAIVRVDPARNLLVLAGTPVELDGMMDTVRLFDVDWLDGMSVALFTPDFVDAKTLGEELSNVFNTSDTAAPLAGLLRIVPIERLNALLVVTPQPQYLGKVREWVARLDRDTGAVGSASTSTRSRTARRPILPRCSPRYSRTTRVKPASGSGARARARVDPDRVFAEQTASGRRGAANRRLEPRRPRDGDDGVSIDSGPVKIIPDDINNALVIKATAEQYRQIVQALRRMDAVPMQVLIEATIAEVSLTGDLSLGLEWFFNNKVGGKQGMGTLDLGHRRHCRASARLLLCALHGGGGSARRPQPLVRGDQGQRRVFADADGAQQPGSQHPGR